MNSRQLLHVHYVYNNVYPVRGELLIGIFGNYADRNDIKRVDCFFLH